MKQKIKRRAKRKGIETIWYWDSAHLCAKLLCHAIKSRDPGDCKLAVHFLWCLCDDNLDDLDNLKDVAETLEDVALAAKGHPDSKTYLRDHVLSEALKLAQAKAGLSEDDWYHGVDTWRKVGAKQIGEALSQLHEKTNRKPPSPTLLRANLRRLKELFPYG